MLPFHVTRILALAAVLTSSVIALAGCQPANTPAPTPTQDWSAIRQAWQSSQHANTYDEGKGPNTYCARCHSPRNWDPAAKVDDMPNCVSCKFSFDPVMRVARSNPPVAKSDWKNIGCEICHKTQNGVTEQQVAWLNAATGQYQVVANTTELCSKCHLDNDVLRHKRDLGDGAHKDYACIRCHNPHSTKASCTAQGCHADVLTAKPVPRHDQAHATVTCIACHDSSGFKVGIEKATGAWITFRTTELLGRSTTAPYQSHRVGHAVDCLKCHAPNNPWGLKPVQGTGQ